MGKMSMKKFLNNELKVWNGDKYEVKKTFKGDEKKRKADLFKAGSSI